MDNDETQQRIQEFEKDWTVDKDFSARHKSGISMKITEKRENGYLACSASVPKEWIVQIMAQENGEERMHEEIEKLKEQYKLLVKEAPCTKIKTAAELIAEYMNQKAGRR